MLLLRSLACYEIKQILILHEAEFGKCKIYRKKL